MKTLLSRIGILLIFLFTVAPTVLAQELHFTGTGLACYVESKEAGTATSACPSGPANMRQFITPDCAGECPVTVSSAILSTISWLGGVNNQVKKFAGPDGRQYTQQMSNDVYVLFRNDPDGTIKIVEDATFSNTEVCSDRGSKAIQRIYDANGNLGGNFAKATMSCGETITNSGSNKGFTYIPNSPLSRSAQQCPSRFIGPLNQVNQLIYHGVSTCNGEEKVEMAALKVASGAGAGEVFVFCNSANKKGLCAWYQSIDFTKADNQPEKWGSRDVCQLSATSAETMRCEAVGDSVNTIIPVKKSVSDFQGTVASIGSLVGLKKETVLSWFGSLKPAGSYNISSPKFVAGAQQVFDATDTDLSPAWFQEKTVHDTKPKPFSMTSRQCIYDPQTGEKIGDFVSEERMEISDVPGLTKMIEASRRGGGMVTGNTQGPNYDDLPPIIVDIDAALSCDETWKGDVSAQIPNTAQSGNSWSDKSTNNVVGAIGGAITNLVYTITNAIIKPSGEGQAKTELTVSGKIVGTGLTSWIHLPLCLLAGCTKEDVASISYASDADKKQLAAGGSIGAMYRTSQTDEHYASELNAGEENQAWQNTVTGDAPKSQTAHKAMGAIEGAIDYINCSLLPAELQAQYMAKGECDTNWTGKPLTTSTTGSSGVSTPPQSCEAYTANSPKSTPSNGAMGNLNQLGYGIPYHNTSCTLSTAAATSIAQKLPTWYGSAGRNSKFAAEWQTVQKYAVEFGWNPAFVIALWIEESAAGGTNNAALSCNLAKYNASSPICEQLSCLFPLSRDNFQDFMCRYAGRPLGCTDFNFDQNECFPLNMHYIYGLVAKEANLGSSCQINGTVKPALVTACCKTNSTHPYCK